MMNGLQFAVFDRIEKPDTSARIAAAIGVTRSAASKAVAALVADGLIQKTPGRNRPLIAATTTHATALRTLLRRFPGHDWPRLLSGRGMEMLAVLAVTRSEPDGTKSWTRRTASEICLAAALGHSAVHRHLTGFARSGVVRKQDRSYRLNEGMPEVAAFVTGYWAHRNSSVARRLHPDARIIWERGPEFLAASPEPAHMAGFTATGPSVMRSFGLLVIPAEHHYLHSRRTLSVGDHVILTFLADPHSMSNVLLAALLHAKTRRADIEKAATRYDAPEAGTRIRDYLRTSGRGREPPFPPWEEFARVAAEYGVTL